MLFNARYGIASTWMKPDRGGSDAPALDSVLLTSH
jgi:hypothetical protein